MTAPSARSWPAGLWQYPANVAYTETSRLPTSNGHGLGTLPHACSEAAVRLQGHARHASGCQPHRACAASTGSFQSHLDRTVVGMVTSPPAPRTGPGRTGISPESHHLKQDAADAAHIRRWPPKMGSISRCRAQVGGRWNPLRPLPPTALLYRAAQGHKPPGRDSEAPEEQGDWARLRCATHGARPSRPCAPSPQPAPALGTGQGPWCRPARKRASRPRVRALRLRCGVAPPLLRAAPWRARPCSAPRRGGPALAPRRAVAGIPRPAQGAR
jgi:hypothetical protein